MQPKGDAEIAENNLAIRLSKALKKKKEGEDPGLEDFLRALPKEPKIAERISTLVRLPKRRSNPRVAPSRQLSRQLGTALRAPTTRATTTRPVSLKDTYLI